ncbi:nitrous oxide reductase accessory protein NosL [Paucibacter sp. APW11]|uniref:Nitrous oxide reductase accessory protein NosL n=1 Tax=Roseateles aquae TaxID=3077235 RepID=A0ABU3P8F3_9BURK|nr:nitrous oxide reductase accessory protein NosL [Paucibacter sp. APW11]MDT8998021.1 nitrous oxide reductase accessory protein NosL [Paucibacter sp. APW11]
MHERRLLLRRLGLLPALAGLPLLGSAAWRSGHDSSPEPGAEALPDDVCIVAPPLAWQPGSSLPLLAARPIPAQARCPVCGMFPARQPRWAAQLIFADGRAHFLDSPLSLFLYLQRVERYAPGYHRADVAALYVSDYQAGSWLDARQAFYIAGSALHGPMRGGNLPAVASQAAAQQLVLEVGGQPLRYAELRQALPEALQRLAPHRH